MVDFTEIVSTKDEDPNEEKFDFKSPEDVLIEVIMDDPEGPKDRWDNYSMELCHVIRQANPDVTGAASYDASYGTGLD